MDELSPPYRRVYFDTNVLIKAKWPQLSQSMRTALTTSGTFQILNVLLDPVEKELEAHWFRDHLRSKTDATGKVKNLTTLFKQVGLDLQFTLPSENRLKKAYSVAVETNVTEYGLIRAAPKFRETEELFQMAIHQRKPFGEKGRNFQDAIICLAAIDDLISSSEKSGAFVSRDGIFEQEMLDGLCRERGITLRLFNGEEALNEDLRSFLRRQTVQRWLEDEENARSSVLENIQGLQSFINKNLEVPTRRGLFNTNRIIFVKQIEIVEVPRVETPYPLERTPEESILITARVEVDIHVRVKRWSSSYTSPESLKAGQAPSPSEPSVRRGILEENEEVLRRTVSMEIECAFRNSRYVNLEPRSVVFGSAPPTEPSAIPPAFGRIGGPILGPLA
jgi:hypothetical protein